MLRVLILVGICGVLTLGTPIVVCGASPAELLERGIELQDSKADVGGAIDVYLKVIAATDADATVAASAYYRLAECYLTQGDREGAAKYLGWMLEKYPDQRELVQRAGRLLPALLHEDVAAQLQRAWSLYGKDNEVALKEFQDVVRRLSETSGGDPKNAANAYNGLGWANFQMGKRSEAAAAWKKCLQADAQDAGALNGMGWLARAEGKNDEAIAWWEKAIAAAPSATASLNGLATVYRERGDKAKAAEVLRKWLAVEPNNADLKKQLAELEGGAGASGTTQESTEALATYVASLVNKEAEKYYAARDKGNPYADKNDLRGAWDQLKAFRQFSPEALQLLLAQIRMVARQKAGDQEMEWRLYDLLGYIEQDTKSAGAVEDYAKALASYPDKAYAEPSKHSKYQHLFNDYAMALWDQKGCSAALEAMREQISTNPRMHFFFGQPWKMRLQNEKSTTTYEEVLTQVREAYIQREKNFPDEKHQIEKYLGQLN